MPTAHSRFPKLRWMSTAALALAALGALSAAAYAAYLAGNGRPDAALAIALGALAVLVLGILGYCQLQLLFRFVNNSYRSQDALLDMIELTRRQAEHARTVAENSSLSDWAKKIIFREKDYEFLRDTIEGAIVRQDWEAAEHLIKEMDEGSGYREEAQRMRDELNKSRRATEQEKITAALERFEMLCASQKWAQAERESKRLLALFPHDSRIGGLLDEIDLRRQQYKRHLLKEYDQASHQHDVDRAHQLLLELDPYLAGNEAAALKESARGIFKAKLQQMGVQFSLAVTEKQYRAAIDVGQRLMREFPNSRFAHEIADMMPALRQRAIHEDARERAVVSA